MIFNSTKKPLAQKRTASALAPMLLLGLTAAGPAAAQGNSFGAATGLGQACQAKLTCQVGETLVYDYAASFVAEGEVRTVADVGRGSSQIAGTARVEMTATQNLADQCTYAVALYDVDVREMVDGVVRHSAKGDDYAGSFDDLFYITRGGDGRMSEVILPPGGEPETVAFKRGLIDTLNVTLQDSANYEILETTIDGTHMARYTNSDEAGFSMLSREVQKGDDKALKASGDGFNYRSQQTTQIQVDHGDCRIDGVEIDEEVVIAAPDANTPPVDDFFRHDTWTVRGVASMQRVDAPPVKNVGRSLAPKPGISYVRLPVDAPRGTLADSPWISKRTAEILRKLSQDPTNDRFLDDLSVALGNPIGAQSFSRFVSRQPVAGEFARSIGAVAIRVGTPQLQATVADMLRSPTLDEKSRERLIILSSLLESPTPTLVQAVSDLADDPHSNTGAAATLALGTYANKLATTHPALAQSLLERLSRDLSTAGDYLPALYLRALGNAGSDAPLDQIEPFLTSRLVSERQSAVVAMRKMDSPRVDRLLAAQTRFETSKSVLQSVRDIARQRFEAGLTSAELPVDKTELVNWTLGPVTYGGNVLNGTLGASALVEAEPYIVDVRANMEIDGWGFDEPDQLFNLWLLTEPLDGDERRFLYIATIDDQNVGFYADEEICSINKDNDGIEDSIELAKGDIGITLFGVLELKVTVKYKVDYGLGWKRQGDWCSAESSLKLETKPKLAVSTDLYNTLTFWFVRGGIGYKGTFVSVTLPVEADADMNFQNADKVCFSVDTVYDFAKIEFYAWGQWKVWPFGWRPRDRGIFTIWENTIASVTISEYDDCEWNPNAACLDFIDWWNGDTIDPWYDGANCYVASSPAGSSPFPANNSFYTLPEDDCPNGMTFDGEGCVVSTFYVPDGIGVSLWPQQNSNQARLVLYRASPDAFFIPPCPQGWQQAEASQNQRVCLQDAPPGYTPYDYYFTVSPSGNSYTIYINGSGSCAQGIQDSIGCFFGQAPPGTTAFIHNNNFYYDEP